MKQRFGPEVTLHQSSLIHPTALVYGKVSIAQGASLWPYAVIRAEKHEVKIGRFSNIQDFAMLHIGFAQGITIGEYCTITHHCILHACTVEDNCLIGINCTIMDGCVVGENTIVAGGSFLKENTVIPPNSIVMGVPGKVMKQRNNFVANRFNAIAYHRIAQAHANSDERGWEGPEYDEFREREMAKVQEEYERLYGGK